MTLSMKKQQESLSSFLNFYRDNTSLIKPKLCRVTIISGGEVYEENLEVQIYDPVGHKPSLCIYWEESAGNVYVEEHKYPGYLLNIGITVYGNYAPKFVLMEYDSIDELTVFADNYTLKITS